MRMWTKIAIAMHADALNISLEKVPAGAWAVGVSGGADSVALLLLLHQRADLRLHVAHLDHQTRGADSAADADFVRRLAERLELPCTLALRREIEAAGQMTVANPSGRYRAARHALFRRVVKENELTGVILAHHADDQAETVLHRLLRGSGFSGLAAMSADANLGGLRILRPLLNARHADLIAFLREIAQPWREDPSNAKDDYFRNRLRRLLAAEPGGLTDDLLALGSACRALRDWVRASAPELRVEFNADDLKNLPMILAEESARRWLIARNVPAEEIVPAVTERLLAICADAATPARVSFPGNILVSRRRGMISAAPATS